MSRLTLLLFLALLAATSSAVALPRRLIIAVDGIAYRDMRALQTGVTCTNSRGAVLHRQAFSAEQGYFPVSRMVSTFPSTSDVAWTDIWGDRPPAGYQRTRFSAAADLLVSGNGVTTTLERERQMDWQLESGYRRAMGYIHPAHTFDDEVRELIKHFRDTGSTNTDYYAYIRSSDAAQHLDRDIFALLGSLDRQLEDLRARYRAQTGRDLQILILSDHGHNHAGAGRRVKVRAFLEKAGYRIAESIVNSNDVVLPTAGIEDWVEIHNAPSETERLAQQLTHLAGVDVLAARQPEAAGRFWVMNSRGERATIEWNPAKDAYRYSTETGDPLNYRPVVEALKREHLLEADGFATADIWMNATMAHHYPLALERIVHGLTSLTLNPATILISLDNQYVNAGWLVNAGSRLEHYGSTHGALDDLNSDGILLANFAPTHDTSSARVARQFDGFPGLRNYRAEEDGAEWVARNEQSLTRIARDPFDRDYPWLPADDVFLRVWSPRLAHLDRQTALEVTLEKIPRFAGAPMNRGDHQPVPAPGRHWTFNRPVSFPDPCSYERVYACPADLVLEPQAGYRISGWIRDGEKRIRLFEFVFHTNSRGRPAAS